MVIFNVPFQSASMSGFGMAFDPSTFRSTHFGSSMKLFLSLVIQADAPLSSINVWESESNCLLHAFVVARPLGHVVVMHIVDERGTCLSFLLKEAVARWLVPVPDFYIGDHLHHG